MICFRHLGLLALAGFLASHGTAHAQTGCADTDAWIDMSAHQVGAGIGYLWGQGTLHDGTNHYRFRVRGGGALNIGGIALSGRGCVRNLARVQDFNGTYWTAGGSATIHHGTTGVVMENARGVDINLHAQTRGAQLSGQVGRLSFRLLDPIHS
ncbi:hypothetical protein [Komagataeibacter oboediens]|uniref:DUF1134 domain-containing protein n=1 Tax=Komagataeibacter oboediens TaxID=65958 RepID=A0ABS5SM67_9PROT|nr:hypothetical protein [Komagataeibacter oboediens]MBL7232604.1 hypothetical protein [Komagataeibacter oboediens]MBT0675261.1 hypothetical protein [Komagataeibacter oboediens]MBT0678872.1 hypothetical protein [Komagataeibacter oboediens]